MHEKRGIQAETSRRNEQLGWELLCWILIIPDRLISTEGDFNLRINA